jgi:hypothetical protein
VGWTHSYGYTRRDRRTAGSRPMLTERFFAAALSSARAPVACHRKGEVMERLLEFLNAEAW